MTLQEYIASLRGKTVAVIGIGVSNTPLLRLLLRLLRLLLRLLFQLLLLSPFWKNCFHMR